MMRRPIIIFFVVLAAACCSARGGIRTQADSVVFTAGELLGRPTDMSIAVSMCADKNIEAYIEYGTRSNIYSNQSPTQSAIGCQPFTLQVDGLVQNTRYYYRVRYRTSGASEFLARAEHTFTTARPRGSQVVFAVEADPHMDESTNPELYRRTLSNMLAADPDFLIDLGDTFMSEKLQQKTQDSVLIRHLLLRSLFETVCHSVPLYLVIGNHEGELGWLADGTSTNLAVMASTTRMKYFANPVPDSFYSGDTTAIEFIGRRQNYYAWESGNALFMVLDPYWYTLIKPGSNKNNWDWTLGRVQYDWLKKTLETSSADFKFVFAHQIVGGEDTEGRGGIEAVPYYEMGGLNADGTPGFAANRPGWPMPVHQLMVKNNVSAFFHGHDHVFVKQDLDGIVYQEVPQPAYYNFTNPDRSYSNISLAAQYGYTHGDILPSSGYLKVTVRDTAAVVEYIRTYLPQHENAQRQNGAPAFSYTIRKRTGATSVSGSSATPNGFSLSQNFPNPFNPETKFEYQIPNAARVRLSVWDVLGREVAVVVDEEKPAGLHRVSWDASGFPSGVYFCRLAAGDRVEIKKMNLIR